MFSPFWGHWISGSFSVNTWPNIIYASWFLKLVFRIQFHRIIKSLTIFLWVIGCTMLYHFRVHVIRFVIFSFELLLFIWCNCVFQFNPSFSINFLWVLSRIFLLLGWRLFIISTRAWLSLLTGIFLMGILYLICWCNCTFPLILMVFQSASMDAATDSMASWTRVESSWRWT